MKGMATLALSHQRWKDRAVKFKLSCLSMLGGVGLWLSYVEQSLVDSQVSVCCHGSLIHAEDFAIRRQGRFLYLSEVLILVWLILQDWDIACFSFSPGLPR